jgi:hypothetical protein
MKNAKTDITEKQIQRALRQFELAGGKIQRIPDQVTPRASLVRSRTESLAGWIAAVPAPANTAFPAGE